MAGKDEMQEENNQSLEKPLSPVLSNYKINRKLLMFKKMQKRSRVKLTDRFLEEKTENVKTTQEITDISHSDTLTLIPNENKNCVEVDMVEVQHIESPEEYTFKTPQLPPGKILKENYFNNSFKTAGGKRVSSLSDDIISKSNALFEDILNPGSTKTGCRSNKYSFLSRRSLNLLNNNTNTSAIEKSVSNNKDAVKDSYNQNSSNYIESHTNNPNILQDCTYSGFKTATGKSFKTSDIALGNARRNFGEDFSDCTLYSYSEVNKTVKSPELDLLSSQETKQLFSDFTLIEQEIIIKQPVKNKEVEQSSKGFTASQRNVKKNDSVFQEFDEQMKNRYAATSSVPYPRNTDSVKRMPQNSESTNFASQKTKPNELQFGGFKSASGKKYMLSESSINIARAKFEEKFEDTNFLSDGKQESKEDSLFSSQETDNLFANVIILENDICDKPSNHTHVDNQFKGFTETDIKDSRMKAEAFMEFFEKYCDNEATIQPVVSCNSTLNEHNLTLRSSSLLNGFFTASGSKCSISKAALEKAQRVLENSKIKSTATLNKKNKEAIKPNMGFKTATGTVISVSESALNKGKHVFKNIENELNFNSGAITDKPFEQITNIGFTTGSGDVITVSAVALSKAKQSFENVESNNNIAVDNYGSKSAVNMSAGTLCEAESTSDNIVAKQKNIMGFKTGTGTAIGVSTGALSNAKQTFESMESDVSLDTSFKGNDTSVYDGDSDRSRDSSIMNIKQRRKKRLGVSACKPVQISKAKIERAMKLLDDEKSSVMSPLKISHPSIYNSTPLKNAPFGHLQSDLTPIKSVSSISAIVTKVEKRDNVDSDRFLVCECTKGSIDVWNEALENEKKKLELRFKIITERQEALKLQKHLLENKQDQQKRRTGILLGKKLNSEKLSLQNFIKRNMVLQKSTEITPQNAEFIHFNYSKENVTSVITLEGACVVPNAQNFVGLSEIEIAFKVMPGVDQNLIPNGWVKNHFKWIIWKLASYERFAENMQDVLTVENVIQQLKYRYDREIDRAERPLLRKIFEKDDAPQKRMVLCVSNIFDLKNNIFELELTDGWYSIKTVIDEPLCAQVTRQKIQIGTKLITYGAELLNCEGCHPLEATDMVRLKINCNSTRRARWDTKLGYQKCPEPFPIKLYSVIPKGGSIGCIKVYIARVYPVKYMEKQNVLNVWRNSKAEELRAQEWENKGRFDVEKVRETVQRTYEMRLQNNRRNCSINLDENEIRNIGCPETLYNLYQTSRDPERLQEILSYSQQQSLMDYQQKLLYRQQQEVSRKIEDSVSRLQIPKRDVTPVLQLQIVDVLDAKQETSVFQIWRPSSTHLDILKETSIFYIYNVVPKKSSGLCATSRTKFQLDMQRSPQFSKYKRTLLPISTISTLTSKPLFNEFDTVGLVVTFSVNDCDQNLWLTDHLGRLLFVKIFEGPKNCLLLDKLKNGQAVAVSNLIYCESKTEFGEAIANHLTVISCYPQHSHLEDGINALNEQLPKDRTLLLQQCLQKIAYYVDKADITRDHKNMSSKSLVKSNSWVQSDVFDDSSDAIFSSFDVHKFD